MITLNIYHVVGSTCYTIMDKKFNDLDDAAYFGAQFDEEAELIFDTWNDETCEQININDMVDEYRATIKKALKR